MLPLSRNRISYKNQLKVAYKTSRKSIIHVMNVHHSREFSSVWWVFIWVMIFNLSDQLSSQRWTYDLVMSLVLVQFLYAVILACLNLSPSYGWAWPSSAQACLFSFFIFYFCKLYSLLCIFMKILAFNQIITICIYAN